MIILIKVVLLIIYTVIIFRLGRTYQIEKTLEFVEKRLREMGIDPDKVGEDE